MSACSGGHLDVVKYVCEIGGKELVMATDSVSGFGLRALICESRAHNQMHMHIHSCLHVYLHT
jgi:hypothetical protein